MGNEVDRGGKSGWRGLVAAGSVAGALAASSCCILPLVFLGLGVGGAWVGNLTALAPYQPFFLAGTAVLLWTGFRMVRRRSESVCAAGTCASPMSQRAMKVSLWLATALVVAALAVDVLGRVFP
ncbi:MAG: mercuric transporter MerT family protein [Leptospirillia bacterium]